MTRVISGYQIGKSASLGLGCSATIFSADKKSILLTRRTDNGQWCLPGGHLNSGESVSACCQREILEELGIQVAIIRLLGVYSDPDRIVEYPDGNRFHIIALNFEVEILSGEPTPESEVSGVRFFSLAELLECDLFDLHRERIEDAFANRSEAAIK